MISGAVSLSSGVTVAVSNSLTNLGRGSGVEGASTGGAYGAMSTLCGSEVAGESIVLSLIVLTGLLVHSGDPNTLHKLLGETDASLTTLLQRLM